MEELDALYHISDMVITTLYDGKNIPVKSYADYFGLPKEVVRRILSYLKEYSEKKSPRELLDLAKLYVQVAQLGRELYRVIRDSSYVEASEGAKRIVKRCGLPEREKEVIEKALFDGKGLKPFIHLMISSEITSEVDFERSLVSLVKETDEGNSKEKA